MSQGEGPAQPEGHNMVDSPWEAERRGGLRALSVCVGLLCSWSGEVGASLESVSSMTRHLRRHSFKEREKRMSVALYGFILLFKS
jgi:hypothetical protein